MLKTGFVDNKEDKSSCTKCTKTELNIESYAKRNIKEPDKRVFSQTRTTVIVDTDDTRDDLTSATRDVDSSVTLPNLHSDTNKKSTNQIEMTKEREGTIPPRESTTLFYDFVTKEKDVWMPDRRKYY